MLYSVSHMYQYSFPTSMCAFHGVLLEKRVSQQVICISEETLLMVCDSSAGSSVIKVHPRRLCKQIIQRKPTVEGEQDTGGEEEIEKDSAQLWC